MNLGSTEVLSEKSESTAPKYGRNNRIECLDFLRGAAIIYVMFYHFAYDLVNFAGVNVPFYGSDVWEAVHVIVLDTLVIISGICSGLSHNGVKRGALLFLLGSALTIFTDLFMPDTLIVFGALSFFGVMMMICALCKSAADKIDFRIILAVSLMLFYVTMDFMSENGTLHLIFTDVKLPLPTDRIYSYPIGIIQQGFYSADYFPLIPYGFLYIAASSLSDSAANGKMPKLFYKKCTVKAVKAVNFIGRHSLPFYLFHQPVLLFIVLIASKIVS
jgi:uncharacterized membrane protein